MQISGALNLPHKTHKLNLEVSPHRAGKSLYMRVCLCLLEVSAWERMGDFNVSAIRHLELS